MAEDLGVRVDHRSSRLAHVTVGPVGASEGVGPHDAGGDEDAAPYGGLRELREAYRVGARGLPSPPRRPTTYLEDPVPRGCLAVVEPSR